MGAESQLPRNEWEQSLPACPSFTPCPQKFGRAVS